MGAAVHRRMGLAFCPRPIRPTSNIPSCRLLEISSFDQANLDFLTNVGFDYNFVPDVNSGTNGDSCLNLAQTDLTPHAQFDYDLLNTKDTFDPADGFQWSTAGLKEYMLDKE